jgi:hypothetical protein
MTRIADIRGIFDKGKLELRLFLSGLSLLGNFASYKLCERVDLGTQVSSAGSPADRANSGDGPFRTPYRIN